MTAPGDLPIEGPTRFEFAVNARTALKIGVVLLPSICCAQTRSFEEDEGVTAELLRLRRIGSGAALGTLSSCRSRRSRAYGSARGHASRGLRHATPATPGSGPTLGPFLGDRTWRASAHRCTRGEAFLGTFGRRRIGRVLLLDGRVRHHRTPDRRA